MKSTIAIGGDHAGFEHKEKLKSFLTEQGYYIIDFGPYKNDSVDYPDFVHPLCESLAQGNSLFGILICGTGNGVAMTANKHNGIRAALCWNTELAELARKHNNANVICFAGRFTAYHYVENMALKFLNTAFEGGRHQRRVNKINC